MKILVTGSRAWPNDTDTISMFNAAIENLGDVGDTEIMVGDCPTGLDWAAREWCKHWSVPYQMFAADWFKHGRAAGPIRNMEMVKAGPDICVGFPHPIIPSRGTLNCMELAAQAGIETVHYQDL